MIGLVVTTYKRLGYLKECVNSLQSADLSECVVVIMDDHSPQEQYEEYTAKIKLNCKKLIIHRNKTNLGVSRSLRHGFDRLLREGCDVLINLDGDSIVKPHFIKTLINLHQQFPDSIVSGFNTLTKNENGIPRHPIKSKHENYCVKASVGGLNMCFSKTVYLKVVIKCLMLKGHWDWNVCRKWNRLNKHFIVSTPSVVQHIGIESVIGNHYNPDISEDF